MISLQELTSVLQSLGKEIAEEDIKEMLEIADKDGKRKLKTPKHLKVTFFEHLND